jgi:hypothetical protein
MDWIESYRAFIGYFEKRIFFLYNEGRSIKIHGIKRNMSIHSISMMKVKHFLRKGCQLYVVEAVSDANGSSLDQ